MYLLSIWTAAALVLVPLIPALAFFRIAGKLIRRIKECRCHDCRLQLEIKIINFRALGWALLFCSCWSVLFVLHAATRP